MFNQIHHVQVAAERYNSALRALRDAEADYGEEQNELTESALKMAEEHHALTAAEYVEDMRALAAAAVEEAESFARRVEDYLSGRIDRLGYPG